MDLRSGGQASTAQELKWERVAYQMNSVSALDDPLFSGSPDPILRPVDRFVGLILSSNPSEIYSGLLGLMQLADASDRSLLDLGEEKFDILAQRLTEINKFEAFQVRYPLFELDLISKLCQKQLKFAHKFWNRDLQQYLLEILAQDPPVCRLDAPIQILSAMSRFATAAHAKLIEWGYIESLLAKVRNPQLNEADLFSVLSGLIQTLDVKHFREIEKLQLILQVVSQEMLTRQFRGPILEKAFGVLLFAVGRVEGPINVEDVFDCCGVGKMALEMLRTELDPLKCKPMVELICNIGFLSRRLTVFFLENGLLDVFGEMARMRQASPDSTPDFDEDLWGEMMRVLSNCMADGAPECYEPVISSPFMDTVSQILHGGTVKMKEQTVIFFQIMLCSEARSGYEDVVIGLLEKYDVVTALSETCEYVERYLAMKASDETDRRGDGVYMILNCLCCIQATVEMVIARRGLDSPLLGPVRDSGFKDTLQALFQVDEKDIQEILPTLLRELFGDETC